jgi:hypothetical protein
MKPRYEEEMECRGWFSRLHLSWPMLFVAGWLLYEFTAQPGLGALVACTKFGWADVRTAFWLRRVDPDRRRGQTCFWAYVTYGLWKVAVMATLAMIALGVLNAILICVRGQPLGNGNLAEVFMGTMAAAAIGFGLSCLTFYIALWSAWRNGVRIWLGHAPSQALKERFWPPRHGRINAAPFVFLTAIIVTLWMLLIFMITLLIVWMPGGFWMPSIIALMLVILVFGVLVLRDATRRLFADAPQECWSAEEGEEVYEASAWEERISEA